MLQIRNYLFLLLNSQLDKDKIWGRATAVLVKKMVRDIKEQILVRIQLQLSIGDK